MTMPQENQQAPTSLYGFADAATAFDQRHPHWQGVMTRLHAVINLAFTRTHGVMANDIDKFVYFYGNLVAEDFMELFLMAANGYGYGALKLLRPMFEHTVTLRYLHDNPDKLQAFMNYDAVQQYKLVKQFADTFGTDNPLSPETIANSEQRYAEVVEEFMVKCCNSKGCTNKRVNHTWGIDFVSMAKKADAIGKMIIQGYYVPMRHTHSTFSAMAVRLERGEGQFGFQRESPPSIADHALMVAHNCVLAALEIQKERFDIPGLEEAIQNSVRDWALVWTPESLAELETGTTNS
jgi:hypothetical protein